MIEKHHELSKTKEILFCWLTSHVGIKGNEAADVKAKASLDLEISNFKLPCTDFKPFINRYILSKWQLSWDRATFNKLHEIKPVLGKNNIYRSLRREELVVTRLRIGHPKSCVKIFSFFFFFFFFFNFFTATPDVCDILCTDTEIVY